MLGRPVPPKREAADREMSPGPGHYHTEPGPEVRVLLCIRACPSSTATPPFTLLSTASQYHAAQSCLTPGRRLLLLNRAQLTQSPARSYPPARTPQRVYLGRATTLCRGHSRAERRRVRPLPSPAALCKPPPPPASPSLPSSPFTGPFSVLKSEMAYLLIGGDAANLCTNSEHRPGLPAGLRSWYSRGWQLDVLVRTPRTYVSRITVLCIVVPLGNASSLGSWSPGRATTRMAWTQRGRTALPSPWPRERQRFAHMLFSGRRSANLRGICLPRRRLHNGACN